MLGSRYRVATITGGCMEPVLCAEDLVVIDTERRAVAIGDVVALPDVAHRVKWVDPLGGIWHGGDRSLGFVRVDQSRIRGMVVAVARSGEWLDIGTRDLSFVSRARLIALGVPRVVLSWVGTKLRRSTSWGAYLDRINKSS